ncbi:MAG: terminase small subunit [Betaproteobacteria bacterium]|nr:terminase small subunit [Betaproteobacteria bacterium]
MTPKQAAFVKHYLVDHNATQAAIRAGYSAKTASSAGERLLRNVEVCGAVEIGMSDIAGRLCITAERVLQERARLAFSDPRKIMHPDGRMRMPQELDDETAAAITSFEFEIDGSIKYKLAGKDQSLAAMEKYFGLNEKPIRWRLPPMVEVKDYALAQAAILQALAGGELLPSEAETLAGLVENQRRAYETSELSKRLASIEDQLKNKGAL